MALTTCRECGERVSSEAGTCPHCGVKNPSGSVWKTLTGGGQKKQEGCFLQTLNCGCIAIFALIALLVVVVVMAGAG